MAHTTLSGRQIIAGTEPLSIDPMSGLRDGADIYEALERMLSEAGESIEAVDLGSVAKAISKMNTSLSEQFELGPEQLEQREEAATATVATERNAILAPFRDIINEYVQRFRDEPLRYPGGGTYGTRRGWMKHFIEDYVVTNRRLPAGEQRIQVNVGGANYSGGSHDFSDLG